MVYLCKNCGFEYVKWQGKCDICQEWNNIASFAGHATNKPRHAIGIKEQSAIVNHPKTLTDIECIADTRLPTADPELNRVLGGGIVPGSFVLLGGDPGIGKSTLLLQMALQLPQIKVLYVSGEETESQIKIRASRLELFSSNCFFLQETSLGQILQHAYRLEPFLLIIDSIQTLYSEEEEGTTGSIHQIRSCTTRLLNYAKSNMVSLFLIGHINKEGVLAGPKLLEHMADTVLQFEGDKQWIYRMVRTIKNRFGATSELGIYEMQSRGLHVVTNPSKLWLSQEDHTLSGIAIGSCLEGTRPLMIEIQSLIIKTKYGYPQRNTTGYDPKRLTMLLAVLEKRTGLRVNDRDVFLNITGGFKVADSALDLAVCMALISSIKDQSLSRRKCFIAEIGLGGELRNVQRIEQRIAEAEKLGFQEVFIATQAQPFTKIFSIKINLVKNIQGMMDRLHSP